MKEMKCPICPRNCDLTNPHCPRGKAYAETGNVPEKKEHPKNRLSFEKKEQQLIMKYLHHAVRVADSGRLKQNMTVQMFEVLSEEETLCLMELLEKLSDHWIDMAENVNE